MMGCTNKNKHEHEGKRPEKIVRKFKIYKKQLAGDKKTCKKQRKHKQKQYRKPYTFFTFKL